MGLTHGNVIFDILEPSAFQEYSICWVFQAFFCSTFFYMYFATRPRPALTAVALTTIPGQPLSRVPCRLTPSLALCRCFHTNHTHHPGEKNHPLNCKIFYKGALLLCRWPLLMGGMVLPLVHVLALSFSFLDLVISAIAFKNSVRETAPIVWLVSPNLNS